MFEKCFHFLTMKKAVWRDFTVPLPTPYPLVANFVR